MSVCIFQGWSAFQAGYSPVFEAGSSLHREVTRLIVPSWSLCENYWKGNSWIYFIWGSPPTHWIAKAQMGCHFPVISPFHIPSSTYRNFQKNLPLPVCTAMRRPCCHHWVLVWVSREQNSSLRSATKSPWHWASPSQSLASFLNCKRASWTS